MTRTEFLIQIKTALDGAGVKLTEDQFKSLGEEVNKTNKASEDLGDELEKTGGRGQSAHAKIKEGAEHSTLSHRELVESLRGVAAQFGGLADVGLWLNPMTAGLAAVLLLVDQIKERLNEATEAGARLAESTGRINEAKMKGFADAASEAAASLAALITEQEKLDAAYSSRDSAMENRIKQYSAERDGVLKVEEAKEAAFEAEIRRRVALGQMSKEAGDATVEQAKLQLEGLRGASDQAKLQEEISERQNKLHQARSNLASGSDQTAIRSAQAAEAPFASAAAKSEEEAKQAAQGPFQSTFTNWRGSQEQFSGSVEDLKKRIQEEHEGQENAESQGMTAIADRYKHDAEALQQILNAQQKYIENLKAIAELEKQHLAQAKGRTEQATDQFRRDSDIDRSGPDRIAVLQQQLELQKRTNEAVQEQHRAAAATNAQTGSIQESQRVRSGRGTPREMQDYGDQQIQRAAAHENGPQASIGAREAVDKARILDANLRGQMPQDRNPADLAELHQLLERMIGYQENHAVSQGQHGELNQVVHDLSDRLHALEMREMNNRTSP